MRPAEGEASRLQVALDWSGDVDLSAAVTGHRKRAILAGADPTEAEAERLARVIGTVKPDFFFLDPVAVPEVPFFREHYCRCGEEAVVGCDACDEEFCGSHAPLEASPNVHFCKACHATKVQP